MDPAQVESVLAEVANAWTSTDEEPVPHIFTLDTGCARIRTFPLPVCFEDHDGSKVDVLDAQHLQALVEQHQVWFAARHEQKKGAFAHDTPAAPRRILLALEVEVQGDREAIEAALRHPDNCPKLELWGRVTVRAKRVLWTDWTYHQIRKEGDR